MYQSIDSDNSGEDAPNPSDAKVWLVSSLMAGSALLLILGWLYSSSLGPHVGQVDPIGPEPEARVTYLRALAETDPALRRARLTDFITQFPENPRLGAVRSQLDVLDSVADRDWQATLTTAYDPRVEIEARRAAVSAYQTKWGRYLGARDTDIQTLLAEIETLPTVDTLPDRTLPRDPEAYRGIPNDRLAGDRFGRQPRVIFRTSRDTRDSAVWGEPSSDERSATTSNEVIGPSVRRGATPRYPRRAQRRGVEAIVVLSLSIDASGRVSTTELVDIETDRYSDDFIKEAERAALRTRFNPRTVDGVPVKADGIQKRYRFELD